MLTKTGEIAATTMVKPIITILGITALPYETFWLCGVVVLCVLDVEGGFTLEEFVKIAASGELGERPRSSVHIKIISHTVLLILL